MSEKKSGPVHVTAMIAYDDDGTRRYKTAIYSVDHWKHAPEALYTTVTWQGLTDYQKEKRIHGITFAFKYE